MITSDKFLVILKECMSLKQKIFFETYIKNKQNFEATKRELDLTDTPARKYLTYPAIKNAIMIINEPEWYEDNSVSLSWLIGEMKARYETCPADEKSKWFDKLMKFQDKYGERKGEAEKEINSMTKDELKAFVEDGLKYLSEYANSIGWKDGFIQSPEDTVSP